MITEEENERNRRVAYKLMDACKLAGDLLISIFLETYPWVGPLLSLENKEK